MANEITPMFDLVYERTNDRGYKVQIWEGVGYELRWEQYSSTGIDIRVSTDQKASKYLPYIYVRTDDEGRPLHTVIQTASYGAIPLDQYEELQRAMAVAQAHAESIEAQFIHPREEGTP